MIGIYKTYKHGGSLKQFSLTKIYWALRRNHINVIKVRDKNRKFRLYVYIPETSRFNRIR